MCKETKTIQLNFQKRVKKGEYFPLQSASDTETQTSGKLV